MKESLVLKKFKNINNRRQFWMTIVLDDRQWENELSILNTRLKNHFQFCKVKYLIMSNVEVGTESKHIQYQKKHVHVYILYEHSRNGLTTFNQLNLKDFVKNGIWIQDKEISDSYQDKIINYTLKNETKIGENALLIELGTKPTRYDTKKRKSRTIEETEAKNIHRVNVAKKCKTLKECIEMDPADSGYWVSSHGKTLFSMFKAKPDTVIPDKNILKKQYIIYGKPGIGKTHTIIQYYQDILGLKVYQAPPGRFWDGYDDQYYDIIFIDDMDADSLAAFGDKDGVSKFKQMTDGKSFWYEEKHQPRTYSLPKIFIISTNMGVENWFDSRKTINPEIHVDAIRRRFNIVSLREFMFREKITWNPDTKKVEKINDKNEQEIKQIIDEIIEKI